MKFIPPTPSTINVPAPKLPSDAKSLVTLPEKKDSPEPVSVVPVPPPMKFIPPNPPTKDVPAPQLPPDAKPPAPIPNQ